MVLWVELKAPFSCENQLFDLGKVKVSADALLELNRCCTNAYNGVLTLHATNSSPSTEEIDKTLNKFTIERGGLFNVVNQVRIAGTMFEVITTFLPNQNETMVYLESEGR